MDWSGRACRSPWCEHRDHAPVTTLECDEDTTMFPTRPPLRRPRVRHGPAAFSACSLPPPSRAPQGLLGWNVSVSDASALSRKAPTVAWIVALMPGLKSSVVVLTVVMLQSDGAPVQAPGSGMALPRRVRCLMIAPFLVGDHCQGRIRPRAGGAAFSRASMRPAVIAMSWLILMPASSRPRHAAWTEVADMPRRKASIPRPKSS